MKKYTLLLMTLLAMAACRKSESGETPVKPDNDLVLEGKITKNRTLKTGNTYLIRGFVYVTEEATLTIEPGTKILGEKGSDTRGTLVISRGAKIIADGTKEKPIIFTSNQPNPQRGDWGGLVILGKAPTNASYNGKAGEGVVEGGINTADGLGLYGGNDPDDNSGILRYIRVEYAGYAYLPDNELNSITFAGVGRGTLVDYVQTYMANDDGIECFGGTVNLNHIVINSTLDDDFDTDNGWSGKVQWLIIMRDSSVADISKSESFESDNDANGSTLSPQTAGVFSNVTIVGPRATLSNIGNNLYLAGVQVRRNSSISLFNSVVMGYGTGILIDASKGTPTDLNISGGKLAIKNTFVSGAVKPVDYSKNSSSPTGWDAEAATAWFLTPAHGNKILITNDDVKLKDAFNYLKPDFTPLPGSPLLNAASFNDSKLTGFTPVTYAGAVGPAGSPDAVWWKGWTKLDI